MSQLSIGVLSSAHPHSHAYVDAITAIEDAAVVCVADEDTQRGRAFDQEHDIDYVSRADLWDRIDAGIVCGANANHASHTLVLSIYDRISSQARDAVGSRIPISLVGAC